MSTWTVLCIFYCCMLTTMARVVVQVLVLLQAVLFFSLTDADVHYVSTNGGDDCPQDPICHSLDYYLSDTDLYFNSYNELQFLEGTHLLDREEPILMSSSQKVGLYLGVVNGCLDQRNQSWSLLLSSTVQRKVEVFLSYILLQF